MIGRNIGGYFSRWMQEKQPHPLLLRGARQIGKSYAVKTFALQHFGEANFIELNFERTPNLKRCFEDLNPQTVVEKIYASTGKRISTGTTLLFLDEIQQCPQAILALRYFYEEMPGLHVIAAGSLLDFVLHSGEISIPVGRVHYIYMKPTSFDEFLQATASKALGDWVSSISLKQECDDFYHELLLKELKKYFHFGGMPEVLEKFLAGANLDQILTIQQSILANYRDDFGKYASKAKHKYLEDTLSSIPKQICKKFKYSAVNPDAKSRDIKEALELLMQAGLAHKIKRANATGLPLEAGASDKHFKVILLDIGLVQSILGLDKDMILAEDLHSIASGALAEQFVGQELLSNAEFYRETKLYYWDREDVSDGAEIDYLLAVNGLQIPVEVKSAKRGSLKSLRYFMDKFKSPIGLRISTNKLDFQDKILSVPLYAISQIPRLIKEAVD